jgi:hypothetical protein
MTEEPVLAVRKIQFKETDKTNALTVPQYKNKLDMKQNYI